MDAIGAVTELIDLRSFSNLWFWIFLAVMWSTASHWVIGVPFDMIQRARGGGSEVAADVDVLIRIYTRRLLFISRMSGMWLVGLSTFALTALGILGFVYRVEFCQALFLLFLPMSSVGALSVRTARRIEAQDITGPALFPVLRWHRFWIQVIGMLSIFVTAMWGMLQNLNIGALGS